MGGFWISGYGLAVVGAEKNSLCALSSCWSEISKSMSGNVAQKIKFKLPTGLALLRLGKQTS
jgi:hypothetical protein